MNCKKCGKELDKSAVVCPGCGCKVSKPIFKKWWFWLIIVIVIIAVASSSGNESESGTTSTETKNLSVSENVTKEETKEETKEIVYEVVDLQVLYDELDSNAMKAEKTYNNKYVEFDCKISSFDSDGDYIAVEPVNASEWNFVTSNCYIMNDTQLNFLLEKSVGDIITIKGKIISIGEILGYSVNIEQVY